MRYERVGALALVAALALQARVVASQQETASPPETRTTPAVELTVYDMRKLAAASTLSDSELAGRRLFVQRCAICHDPVGQPLGLTPGPWLDQGTFASGVESAARAMIEIGSRRMPGFGYALRTTQIDQIVEYLKTVTPDRRPD